MKRKIEKTGVIFIIILILVFGIGVYFIFHPTYWKYNDSWIIGKHYTEIEKRYGEFDKGSGVGRGGYYVGYWNDDGGAPIYYFIYFDENGYAIRVKKEIHNPGG